MFFLFAIFIGKTMGW